mgnify:CR=1 FL=1
MPPSLAIDLFSDIVCPWCFIGKRRLESALRMYSERFPDEDEPAVRWLPFQLNPEMPPEGVARAAAAPFALSALVSGRITKEAPLITPKLY